jgi:hypothetical protein
MLTDAQLLQRYIEDRSDQAFAELVRRHVDGVRCNDCIRQPARISTGSRKPEAGVNPG